MLAALGPFPLEACILTPVLSQGTHQTFGTGCSLSCRSGVIHSREGLAAEAGFILEMSCLVLARYGRQNVHCSHWLENGCYCSYGGQDLSSLQGPPSAPGQLYQQCFQEPSPGAGEEAHRWCKYCVLLQSSVTDWQSSFSRPRYDPQSQMCPISAPACCLSPPWSQCLGVAPTRVGPLVTLCIVSSVQLGIPVLPTLPSAPTGPSAAFLGR